MVERVLYLNRNSVRPTERHTLNARTHINKLAEKERHRVADRLRYRQTEKLLFYFLTFFQHIFSKTSKLHTFNPPVFASAII